MTVLAATWLVAACNGSVAGDDAGDAGSTMDATTANDATVDAGADVVDAAQPSDASGDSSGSQCAYSIAHVDDAGVCHTTAGDIDCEAQDPNYDRCVGAFLHGADGGSFGALQCFDSDANTGTIVCCNGTNPSGDTLLVAASWTCCPGAAPDGGTAACDPDAGQACLAVDGGWVCQ